MFASLCTSDCEKAQCMMPVQALLNKFKTLIYKCHAWVRVLFLVAEDPSGNEPSDLGSCHCQTYRKGYLHYPFYSQQRARDEVIDFSLRSELALLTSVPLLLVSVLLNSLSLDSHSFSIFCPCFPCLVSLCSQVFHCNF